MEGGKEAAVDVRGRKEHAPQSRVEVDFNLNSFARARALSRMYCSRPPPPSLSARFASSLPSYFFLMWVLVLPRLVLTLSLFFLSLALALCLSFC